MSPSTNGASASAGAPRRRKAAQAEVKGRREIDLTSPALKGLKLTALKNEPSTFRWDLSRAQALLEQEDPRAVGVLYLLVESVLEEEGTRAIRQRLAEKPGLDGSEVLVQTVGDIATAYGSSTGE